MKTDKHEEARRWIDWIYTEGANHFSFSDMQTFLDALDDLEDQLK